MSWSKKKDGMVTTTYGTNVTDFLWRFLQISLTTIQLSEWWLQEGFDDTKGVIRIRKSKDRQHNGHKKKYKKNKQQSTKHTHKTKDRVTRTLPKTGVELGCSERVSNSCSTSDTCRVNLAANPVISHERGKDREVFTTSGTYPLSFVTQIFHIGQPCHGGDRKTFEVMTSAYPRGTMDSVASFDPLSRTSSLEPLTLE
jgi:hypothetical protein